MIIRSAQEQDIPGICRLLVQIHGVHYRARPDIFRANVIKYTAAELETLIRDPQRPMIVAVDESGRLLGYALCIFQQHIGHQLLTDIKTLYLDDFCVDESVRNQHIGEKLYQAVLALARENGCYNVTLNVWNGNEGALRFYEKHGMKPQKICMEQIL